MAFNLCGFKEKKYIFAAKLVAYERKQGRTKEPFDESEREE